MCVVHAVDCVHNSQIRKREVVFRKETRERVDVHVGSIGHGVQWDTVTEYHHVYL